MALIDETGRQRIWRGLMRFWSNQRSALGVNKTNLRAAIDATDQWIEDNQTSFNNALPTNARNNLTAAQKTILFCAVALARVGLVELKVLFGEVD